MNGYLWNPPKSNPWITFDFNWILEFDHQVPHWTFSQKLTWEVDPTRIFTWKINLLIGPQCIKTMLETSEHWMRGISFFILLVLIHQTSWHYGLNIFRSACLFIVCKRRRKCFHQDLNMGFHTTHYNPSPSPRAISIDQCMDKTFLLNLFFFLVTDNVWFSIHM